MYFPDYQGIEIKCTQRFSGYLISLFSLAFDGPALFQMNKMLMKYGKQDRKYKDKKMLLATLSLKEKVLVNQLYYFKLNLSEDEGNLYLYDADANSLFQIL